jgi:Siphovirus Gp157
MLAEVIRSALEDEALATGLSPRLSDMKARLERLETRATRKHELALQEMSEAEIAKVMEADFTASLWKGSPAVEVTAQDKIPAAYWKPQPPKLDRQGLQPGSAGCAQGGDCNRAPLWRPRTCNSA